MLEAINRLLGDRSTYQAQLQQNIAKIIRCAQQNTADGIDEKLMELQNELLKKTNNKEAYNEIADEIFKLREQRQQCTVDTAARDAQIERINEMQDFIKDNKINPYCLLPSFAFCSRPVLNCILQATYSPNQLPQATGREV